MIIILSPAKSLNFKLDSPTNKYSHPVFVNEAQALVKVLRTHSPANITDLMKISNGLGELNFLRYQKWEPEHTLENSKQAIFAFNGEVYNGLNATTINNNSLLFAQKHIRILSGLYGLLKPLDLIQPYRLEMGTKLPVNEHKNLYSYWNNKINTSLNQELNDLNSKCLINLASNEYAKAARLKKINSRVITPVFKELKGDVYKVITVYAKKARGLMTRFIADNKIDNPEDIKHFDTDSYQYNDRLSSENEWVFTRLSKN